MQHQSLIYIHPDAKVADNVHIEPFVNISADVEIDEGCWIGSNVCIMDGARIGKNCKIFPGAVISAIPQDLKYNGETTYVEIGDNNIIRECVTINKGTVDRGVTKIGNDNLLMAYCHIAHDVLIGNNCVIANTVQLAGHITIGDYAIIGGMTAIHQFCNIGKHSIISGGSLVRKSVPPFVTAAREPLSYAGLNSIGLKRRSFSQEKIEVLKDVYRILFQSKLNVTSALKRIEEDFESTPEIDEVLSFIKNEDRGIIRGFY